MYKKIAAQRGVKFLAASDYATASEVDDEHLNEEGHQKLAEAIYEALQPGTCRRGCRRQRTR